ncbi:MAG: hypothetical protein RQ750_18700, partial [Roseovarius sp.]|nr:hypothetical protein [Roseovarius sp.]
QQYISQLVSAASVADKLTSQLVGFARKDPAPLRNPRPAFRVLASGGRCTKGYCQRLKPQSFKGGLKGVFNFPRL